MFRRLRYKLALQFTGLVFALMLVLGAVFIAIEFTDVNRQLDDRLQRQSRGTVTPDSFTHGSSAQRVRWFKRGFETGVVGQCNTFPTDRL